MTVKEAINILYTEATNEERTHSLEEIEQAKRQLENEFKNYDPTVDATKYAMSSFLFKQTDMFKDMVELVKAYDGLLVTIAKLGEPLRREVDYINSNHRNWETIMSAISHLGTLISNFNPIKTENKNG